MALAALIGFTPARAQTFPDIPIWSFAGAPQAGADSVAERGRTITVKFVRDPAAEARSDFGGYRIYRVYNALDSTKMVLVRRFSRQDTDTLFLWHFPFPISPSTPVASTTLFKLLYASYCARVRSCEPPRIKTFFPMFTSSLTTVFNAA